MEHLQPKEKDLFKMLRYHEKYGKRRGESFSSWIMKKRTINTAFAVSTYISDMSFAEVLAGMYFHCDDNKYGMFRRYFESLLELAYLEPEELAKSLDTYYMQMCRVIESKKLYSNFFDFCKLLEQQQDKKRAQGYIAVYNAYYSLVMQQSMYFCRDRIEENVCGMDSMGNLMYVRSFHPYIDVGSFNLEKYYHKWLSGKEPISVEQIHRAYTPYGYNVWSLDEIHFIEAITKTNENNTFAMIPYINENTPHLLIKQPYLQQCPDFPRQWKTTDFYLEKLKHRNYMLPSSGIEATYHNAGDILRIFFQEVLYHNEMVLLYKVTTQDNGEYTGYYHTKSQYFYSIYKGTDKDIWHDKIKNFILENYMILTCEYEIDRKKNYAIRQVDRLQNEFHYPEQPLVIFNYQSTSEKGASDTAHKRKYVKEEYQEEMITRCGYIRRLPIGQHASEEAIQNALSLGLELPEGRTYVRSHEFTVYRKVIEM